MAAALGASDASAGQQPQQVPQLSCLPSSSWLAAARRRRRRRQPLLSHPLFFARLGLGGQEALLVEVASGVLEDPEVPAILMYPDVS